MNARCENSIAAKNSAEGHASFEDQREKCAGVLAEEHQKYVATLKEKISKLKKGSKQYWRLNRELLCKKGECSSIPPLRDGTLWVNSSKDKAAIFAKTFADEAVLADEHVDWPFFGRPDSEFDEFVALNSRYTATLIKELDESKTTRPDCIPATILKRVGCVMAGPFTKLCRRLLREACWPKVWCLHHVCPLYKRDSASAAGNY